MKYILIWLGCCIGLGIAGWFYHIDPTIIVERCYFLGGGMFLVRAVDRYTARKQPTDESYKDFFD